MVDSNVLQQNIDTLGSEGHLNKSFHWSHKKQTLMRQNALGNQLPGAWPRVYQIGPASNQGRHVCTTLYYTFVAMIFDQWVSLQWQKPPYLERLCDRSVLDIPHLHRRVSMARENLAWSSKTRAHSICILPKQKITNTLNSHSTVTSPRYEAEELMSPSLMLEWQRHCHWQPLEVALQSLGRKSKADFSFSQDYSLDVFQHAGYRYRSTVRTWNVSFRRWALCWEGESIERGPIHTTSQKRKQTAAHWSCYFFYSMEQRISAELRKQNIETRQSGTLHVTEIGTYLNYE